MINKDMRLYEFITPPESADEPVFHWYINGDTAFISNFVIPAHLRGKGEGRKMYEDWENSLPSSVVYVQLRAKDASAKAFWTVIGFEDLYSSTQGVNGEAQMVKIR